MTAISGRVYRCPWCPEEFTAPTLVAKHKRQIHAEEMQALKDADHQAAKDRVKAAMERAAPQADASGQLDLIPPPEIPSVSMIPKIQKGENLEVALDATGESIAALVAKLVDSRRAAREEVAQAHAARDIALKFLTQVKALAEDALNQIERPDK